MDDECRLNKASDAQPSHKAPCEDCPRRPSAAIIARSRSFEIEERLAQALRAAPDVHPNIAEACKCGVERFVQALTAPEPRLGAAAANHSLIGRFLLTGGGRRGQVLATLHGEIMAILDFANENPSLPSDALVMFKVPRVCRRCGSYESLT